MQGGSTCIGGGQEVPYQHVGVVLCVHARGCLEAHTGRPRRTMSPSSARSSAAELAQSQHNAAKQVLEDVTKRMTSARSDEGEADKVDTFRDRERVRGSGGACGGGGRRLISCNVDAKS